jgi:hypothetical protein
MASNVERIRTSLKKITNKVAYQICLPSISSIYNKFNVNLFKIKICMIVGKSSTRVKFYFPNAQKYSFDINWPKSVHIKISITEKTKVGESNKEVVKEILL